jgi:hypothetical protein
MPQHYKKGMPLAAMRFFWRSEISRQDYTLIWRFKLATKHKRNFNGSYSLVDKEICIFLGGYKQNCQYKFPTPYYQGRAPAG